MKRSVTALFASVLILLACAAPRAFGQDEQKTHEVKAEKFEIQIELSGVFAAEKTAEVSVEPKTWSQFKVVEAVPHGSKVTEGQVLVRFDAEDLNKAIEDMQSDQQLAELAIIQAEEELPRLEKSLNLQYEAAERANRIAQEDFQRWNDIDRPLAIKSVEFSLRNSKNNLEYQQEELKQLQQMYEADELTEETEEIILKRQRNAVESAEFYFELAQNRHEEMLKLQIPRADAAMKIVLEQAELSLARAKSALALSTNEKQFSLQKAKHARQRSLERYAHLLADRDLLIVKAPMDGTVYYGRAVDGKWSGISSMIESLKPGGSVSPKSVFMTVVQLRPVRVRTNVTEKNITEIKKDGPAQIIPTANDESKIEAKVAEVSPVPTGEGQFSLDVELTGGVPEWVVPGMTCKVKVTTYVKEDALTVPSAAVRTDEEDKEKKYVLVKTDDSEEPQRRDVKVGKTHEGKMEILEGLEAGDQVVLGEPKKNGKADPSELADAESDEKDAEKEAGEEEAEEAPEKSDESDDDDDSDDEQEESEANMDEAEAAQSESRDQE